MAEFISMRSFSSGPGDLCQHAVQRAPRQRYLEIVAAEPARAFEHGIRGRIEGCSVCGGVDQSLFRLCYAPRAMCQTTEGEPGRADPAVRAIDDRCD